MPKLSQQAILLMVIITTTACTPFSDGCPDAEIKWMDVVKVNDREYQHDFVEEPEGFIAEKGKKIGEVSYKMADNACSNHKMENGDAAFLSKGTDLFEVKGYPSSLMITDGNRVFVIEENSTAKKVEELYPVQGKVKNVLFKSTNDDSIIHTFSEASKNEFLKGWLSLDVYEPEKFAKVDTTEEERVFIGIELENGVVFRVTYWSDHNFFSDGTKGSDALQKLVKEELSKVKGM
jgi:hypothetical protein